MAPTVVPTWLPIWLPHCSQDGYHMASIWLPRWLPPCLSIWVTCMSQPGSQNGSPCMSINVCSCDETVAHVRHPRGIDLEPMSANRGGGENQGPTPIAFRIPRADSVLSYYKDSEPPPRTNGSLRDLRLCRFPESAGVRPRACFRSLSCMERESSPNTDRG